MHRERPMQSPLHRHSERLHSRAKRKCSSLPRVLRVRRNVAVAVVAAAVAAATSRIRQLRRQATQAKDPLSARKLARPIGEMTCAALLQRRLIPAHPRRRKRSRDFSVAWATCSSANLVER
jgi:hypothetical protein